MKEKSRLDIFKNYYKENKINIYKKGVISSPIGIIIGYFLTVINPKYPEKILGELMIVIFVFLTLIYLFLYWAETRKV
jgi:hypothetical protein